MGPKGGDSGSIITMTMGGSKGNCIYFIKSLFSLKLILNLSNFKWIVLFCTLAYSTFFIIFTIFSYKAYLNALNELSNLHSFNMVNDISKLIYDFPILNNHIQQMPLENINLVYRIHGIENYSQFIYPVNREVEILHSILNYEPELASRFSSMVIQDIVDTHSREVYNLTEHFVNRMINYSIPLGAMIVLVVIVTMDPIAILA